MKKKSNRNLLTKYVTKIIRDKKQLGARRTLQIESQMKMLDLVDKITFWNDYEG